MIDAKLHEEAMTVACRVVREYGEGNAQEQEQAATRTLCRDHPVYQAAYQMAESLVRRLAP